MGVGQFQVGLGWWACLFSHILCLGSPIPIYPERARDENLEERLGLPNLGLPGSLKAPAPKRQASASPNAARDKLGSIW